MATDLRESWWGRNFEKVVLAAAALVLVVAAVLLVVLRPSRVGEREVVRRLIDQIRQRDEDTIEEVLPKDEQERLGLAREPLTVQDFEDRLAQLPADWPAEPDFIPRPVTGEIPPTMITARTPPKQILAVEALQTAVGRGVTSETVSHPLERMADHNLMDVAWVSCTGKFNLTFQVKEYQAGNAKEQPIVITRVEMSRREQKGDGTWSDWEAVPAQGAKAVLDKLPRRPENSRDGRGVFAWARAMLAAQESVCRLPMVELVANDPEGQTISQVAGEVQGVRQPTWEKTQPTTGPEAGGGLPAPAGGAPAAPAAGGEWFEMELPPAAPAGPAAPETEAPLLPEFVLATVWAHDLSMRPGRTYQYRMRVSVFNPVYGSTECEDEEARWTPELTGEWSEPTESVTIPRLVHFYFVGTFGDRVNLELHRWIHGQWVIMRSVPCRVGAPVIFSRRMSLKVPGTTKEVTQPVDLSPGVLLVDLVRSFPYTPLGLRTITTSVLVYADAQGNLEQRIEWEEGKEAVRWRQQREQVVPPTTTTAKPKRGD